jgi:hypothetical protein
MFAVVIGEAAGASKAFEAGVANVVKSRASLVNGNFAAVANQAGAFSSFNSGDPNRATVDAVLEHGAVTDEVRDIVESVYRGTRPDNTNGALLFYSPQSMRPTGTAPIWNMNVLKETLDLGDEGKFYACKQGTSCWRRP